MATTFPSLESRAARTERREREEAQKTSRLLYGGYVNKTNNHAIKHVLAKNRADRNDQKRSALRTANPDESQAPISKWTWSVIILIALMAVVAIDYLIIGGTLDYLLGMQRELQGQEDQYLYLKLLGTFALLIFEIAVAIGLVLLRDKIRSRLAVFFHWFIGIGLALALTAFAFGLIYTKIKNESVAIPAVEVIEVADSSTAVAGITYSEIPLHKKILVVGLCCVCFFVHIFALIKADSVSEAFSLAGYGVKHSLLALKGTIHRFQSERAARKTESTYRRAYDQFESHNDEFPNDPLPWVASQQDPNQRIPLMRLSPVAQRIIENLQNGVVENFNSANDSQTNQPTTGAATPENNEPSTAANQPWPAGPANQAEDGDANPGNVANEPDIAADSNDNEREDAEQRNRADAAVAEAEYLRTILDAQVRNAEGEI